MYCLRSTAQVGWRNASLRRWAVQKRIRGPSHMLGALGNHGSLHVMYYSEGNLHGPKQPLKARLTIAHRLLLCSGSI